MSDLENFTAAKKAAEKNGPPPARPPTFSITELHVRAQLGLNKDEVRALRQVHLVENQHWVLYHKRILYCPDGVRQLEAAIGVYREAAAEEGARSSNAAQGEASAEVLEELVVWRTGLRNPHIILAHRAGADPQDPAARVRVRVRRDRNLIRGMTIPCRLLPGYTDLYELAHALPRRRGLW